VRCLNNQSQATSSLPPIQVEKAIIWAQEKAGFSFADQQAEAVRQALQSKISILTGGPGTGKTTILRALVSILRAKKTKILLAAPTGRAACTSVTQIRSQSGWLYHERTESIDL
jgi:exodeoxyribonuclease V alpha subunit